MRVSTAGYVYKQRLERNQREQAKVEEVPNQSSVVPHSDSLFRQIHCDPDLCVFISPPGEKYELVRMLHEGGLAIAWMSRYFSQRRPH
jgi:hypothetical protein